MILKKVSYLTIDALSERRERMESWLDTAQVPHNAREPFKGIDGAAYPTLDALLREAPAWMEGIRHSWMQRGDAAFQWGWHHLFQTIAKEPAGHCVLMLLDDAKPTRRWKDYIQLAAELPDFDIVQLLQWNPGDSDLHVERKRGDLRVCPQRPDFTYGTHFPGEHGMLVSPAGAYKCLTHIEQKPAVFLEGAFIDMPANWCILSPLPPLRPDWIYVEAYTSYREKVNNT